MAKKMGRGFKGSEEAAESTYSGEERMDEPYAFGDRMAQLGPSTTEAGFSKRLGKPQELDHPCNGTFTGLRCEKMDTHGMPMVGDCEK